MKNIYYIFLVIIFLIIIYHSLCNNTYENFFINYSRKKNLFTLYNIYWKNLKELCNWNYRFCILSEYLDIVQNYIKNVSHGYIGASYSKKDLRHIQPFICEYNPYRRIFQYHIPLLNTVYSVKEYIDDKTDIYLGQDKCRVVILLTIGAGNDKQDPSYLKDIERTVPFLKGVDDISN